MGILFDEDVPTEIKFGIIILLLFLGFAFETGYGKVDTQLANAICEEHYGTELDYIDTDGWGYNVDKVVCKEKIKQEERYDGLIIKINGG